MECAQYFQTLWNERVNADPGNDLISMLAHSPATRDMTPEEYLGNVLLLIVGGNDTTRNSMTGGVLALHQNPDQMAKLKASEVLAMIADEAIQIHGGMGLMDELPLERIWRDARIERIWEGTSEIQRHIISRALLRPHGA